MTPDEILAAMVGQAIMLVPRRDRRGKIIRWSAGAWSAYDEPTGRWYVPTDGFAWGRTPGEAMAKLLAGETVYRLDETGYVQAET